MSIEGRGQGYAECEGVILHTWCGQLLHTQLGWSVC